MVFDDHAGLKAAIREILPAAAWRRCYVHVLRNTLDYVLPRQPGRQIAACFGQIAAGVKIVLGKSAARFQSLFEDGA